MTAKTKYQPTYWVILITVIAMQWGCAAQPPASVARPSCTESDNLLIDTGFTLSRETDQRWQLSQHTGPQSFQLTSSDGALRIERIGDEPWMLLQQTVKDERFKGATLVYRVEMKGEGLEGNFGFEPKAGIYTRIGTGGRAQLAPQGPNLGDWEWQTFEERIPLPSAVDRVQVGLVHQTGGVLLARNPSLVIERCELDEGA